MRLCPKSRLAGALHGPRSGARPPGSGGCWRARADTRPRARRPNTATNPVGPCSSSRPPKTVRPSRDRIVEETLLSADRRFRSASGTSATRRSARCRSVATRWAPRSGQSVSSLRVRPASAGRIPASSREGLGAGAPACAVLLEAIAKPRAGHARAGRPHVRCSHPVSVRIWTIRRRSHVAAPPREAAPARRARRRGAAGGPAARQDRVPSGCHLPLVREQCHAFHHVRELPHVPRPRGKRATPAGRPRPASSLAAGSRRMPAARKCSASRARPRRARATAAVGA